MFSVNEYHSQSTTNNVVLFASSRPASEDAARSVDPTFSCRCTHMSATSHSVLQRSRLLFSLVQGPRDPSILILRCMIRAGTLYLEFHLVEKVTRNCLRENTATKVQHRSDMRLPYKPGVYICTILKAHAWRETSTTSIQDRQPTPPLKSEKPLHPSLKNTCIHLCTIRRRGCYYCVQPRLPPPSL